MTKLGLGLCHVVGLGLLAVASAPPLGAGQDRDRGPQPAKRGAAPVVQMRRAERAAVSLPVRDLPREAPKTPDPNVLREVPNEPDESQEEQGRKLAPTATKDGAAQLTMPEAVMPAATVSFQGISQATQGAVSGFFFTPPDTVGDVGPNHYVQCVNAACQIFNRTGTPLAPPFKLQTLFGPLGGDCSTTNDGDPIVLYDPLADRWHLSQFSIDNRPPSHECVAVSQTGDPTGAYYLYDFVIPGNYFNDYPKFGVWPDGYYMTAPLFEGPVFGQGVFVMNRTKMLVGDPSAEMIFFDLTVSHPGLQRLLPADVDGPPPPAGTPNYMVSLTADELGDLQDGVRIFSLQPDFGNPSASSFTELPSLAVASYDPTFTEVGGTCSGTAFTFRDDIEQPPPANCGHRVDSISDRPMHRLAYRNSGTHESLVTTHTVDVNATPPSATSGHLAGIRYFELRRPLPGGDFTVNEQATFAPDSVHRWMGSAAMDAQGNIAVGYSVSAATATFPGVRYAGRLATDPPGGLFQGEATLVAGGRSQTSTASRWGDYSAMSVDPVDDCTFWYTQQYYDPITPPSCSATGCWQTRVGSFKFPSCTSTTAFGTLQGTVTDAGTSTPLSGVAVQANGYAAVTNGSGAYSMSVTAGTYTVTAFKSGYGEGSATGVAVAGSGTTTQNFSLGSGSIAGVITDSVTTNPIAGALVQVSGGPHVLTNASGAYGIPLSGGTYALSVSKASYFTGSLSGLVVGNSGVTAGNLALVPAPVVNASASAVDDSIGNSNGAVDIGECFKLNVTLVNSGSTAATGISATLSTSAPGVVITQGVSAYPNLAGGGGSGTNSTPFQLTSSSDPAAAGKPIALTLNVTTATGPLVVPVVLATGGGGTPSTFSATGPVPIPDNDGTGAALAIPVSGFAEVVSKVKVSLRITQTFDGDLVLRLISPDNQVVLLAYQVGAAGDGFGTDCPAGANDTTFDDAAATSITSGAAPFVGSFRPQEALSAFGGKFGAQVNGNWQLQAIDLGPADIGNIECATLTLNGSTFGGCFPANLSITKTDGVLGYTPGQPLNYTIVAGNAGPFAATGATVTDAFPASLTGVSWTCLASSGSACGSASGTGNITTTADLLVGGTATFAVISTISPAATGDITNTATIAPATGIADPNVSNNTATDTDSPVGSYFTLTPCRLIDTRNPDGPLGGPALVAGANRTFQVTGNCGVPAGAKAVFLNITVVSPTTAGNLRVFPTGAAVPTVSAINYSAAQTRGNNGAYALDTSGRFDIRCAQASGNAHVVVDVAGYFVE